MKKLILISALLFSFNGWADGIAKTFYDGVVGPLSITKDGIATLSVPVGDFIF